MGLLNRLKRSLKFWWKPFWEQDYSYEVVLYGEFPLFIINKGRYSGNSFYFEEILIKDDKSLDFALVKVKGKTPNKIAKEIFNDYMARVIDRHNQLHREVLNDNTEDSRTDYFEEPVDERRVCPPSTSISKE